MGKSRVPRLKSLTNYITVLCVEYISSTCLNQSNSLAVIGNDCIFKCKSNNYTIIATTAATTILTTPGADPGFQVRGAHLKKLLRAEGGAKIFGVFRVKNHDFTPKNHIFSNCGGRCENCWGISCEKSGSAPALV